MSENSSERRESLEPEAVYLPAKIRPIPVIAGGASPAALDAHVVSSSTYGAGDLWLVMRRWWWQCLIAGTLLATVTGAAIWVTFEPVYESIAWLELKSQPIVIAFEQTNHSGNFAETQLQTIRSPVVLSKVAAKPEIANQPEARTPDEALIWLTKGLKVGFLGRSELCEIRFKAARPDTAQQVANAIMDTYLSLHSANTSEETKRVVELLKEEKVRRAEEVRSLQERVRLLTKSATEEDPNQLRQEEHVFVGEHPLTKLEEHRSTAEVERAVLEAKLKAFQESDKPNQFLMLSPNEVSLALDQHPEIKALASHLLLLRNRLREHQRRSSVPNDSSAAAMSREIEEYEAMLKKTAAELKPQVAAELQAKADAARESHIAALKTNIEHQRMLEDLWRDRIEDQRKKIERLGDKSVDLDFARAEFERAQEVFHRISDRIVALQTEMSAPLRATPLKRADAPTKPLEILPFKRLAGGCGAMFLLPFGLALAWERWSRRIHDAQQLAQEINLPVLGEISALPTRWAKIEEGTEGSYLRERLTFEESIDSLRLGLMLSPRLKDIRSLVITSAISREGKTSVSSALAASLAKSTREPILLIDGDMRCPSGHEIFGVALEPGLAEVLGQRCAVEDAIVELPSFSVHFLPAGRLRASPHSVLRHGEFAPLLAELLTRYRYVVVDSPPVLAASEALILASAAQGTLVCTMRDISRGPQFRMTCDRLIAAGATLVGTVISGLPASLWAYKYGGYGYGWDRYSGYLRRGNPAAEPQASARKDGPADDAKSH